MKQPTITVVLIASENRFTNQKEVKMDALVRVKNPSYQSAGYGIMEVSARHNPKYSTAQYLCMLYGKPLNVEKKSVKVTLENLPCEYIKGKRTDGTDYYAVLVNLNGKTGEDAMMRIFYLDAQQIRSIHDFKPEYEFVESTRELPEDEEEDTENVTFNVFHIKEDKYFLSVYTDSVNEIVVYKSGDYNEKVYIREDGATVQASVSQILMLGKRRFGVDNHYLYDQYQKSNFSTFMKLAKGYRAVDMILLKKFFSGM